MKLTVTRHIITPNSTIGMLDVDGVFQCYTLEPPLAAAIPDGTYPLKLLPSPHFMRPMPHVCDVPGHTEIELHPGNFPKDTKGCTLVGMERGTDAIWRSQDAFAALMKKIEPEFENGLTIEYITEQAISA